MARPTMPPFLVHSIVLLDSCVRTGSWFYEVVAEEGQGKGILLSIPLRIDEFGAVMSACVTPL